MRWLAKAMVKKTLSYIPGGEQIDYLIQRYVTRKLPHSEKVFLISVGSAAKHFDRFLRYKQHEIKPETAVFYEFGTGWELTIPITYYLFGVRNQILTDIRPNLRVELINSALSRFHASDSKIKQLTGTFPRDALPRKLLSPTDVQNFGMTYRICDAAKTDLPTASVDFISSTSTLEHIPADDMQPILAECRRLLKPSGIISVGIDLTDHYSHFDHSLTVHNYLRFSEDAWKIFNSPLHYQNRLRPKDYLNMMKSARFELLTHGVRTKPTNGITVHRSFSQRYDISDLLATGLYVVAKAA